MELHTIDRDALIKAIIRGIPGNPKMCSTIGTPMEGREGEIADKMIRTAWKNPSVREAIDLYLSADHK